MTNEKEPAEKISTIPFSGNEILFGDFRLSPSTRVLTKDGKPIHLGGRALDILIALIGRAGEVVSKAELFANVWPNTHIEESNLRVHIAALRKALGGGRAGARFIASVPGRGYTFIASVKSDPQSEAAAAWPRQQNAVDKWSTPIPLVRIIGRDAVVTEIAARLRRERLVTVAGAGGIGKTAVAITVARTLAPEFDEGWLLVDLASLTGPSLVSAHLASLLRVPAPHAQPLAHVIENLRSRHILLLFDNCEHVIEAASAVVESILPHAPRVHILTTSREPLRVTGEWVQRLDPLALPPEGDRTNAADVVKYPAVQLLVERSLACDAAFELSDADASVAAEICARLDGLPLAIELAATRVPLFGLKGLASRLDDRFAILTKGRRTALSRHQTLGAMIDWSYETLGEEEKTVWRRLAVFRGAFTIEAADVLGSDPPADNFNIVDILDGLVEKSLIFIDRQSNETRYHLLESFRLYTLNKLVESGEAECVRARHANYWYRRCAGLESNWVETPSPEWLRRYSGEMADIRAALDWAYTDGDPILGIKLTAASAPLWFKTLLLPELRAYLERAIRLAADYPEIGGAVLMRLHIALSHSIFHTQGSVTEVATVSEKGIPIA